MNLKRLFPYLVLNILVSAGITLLVLSWWDRNHNPVDVPILTPLAPISTPTPEDPPTLPPTDKPLIQIKNVFGVGDLQNEVIVLSRQGNGVLELTGWQIKDENKHGYTFPKLLLNQDGGVQVFTRAGADSVIELHWGLEEPVWNSGELVSLFDTAGNLRASYHIP
jgi:hypothetical protein